MSQDKENQSRLEQIDKATAQWIRQKRLRLEAYLDSLYAKMGGRPEGYKRRVSRNRDGKRSD